MSTLLDHIQNQQARAMHLEYILEAAMVLDNEGLAPAAISSLISTARDIAGELNAALDSVALPEN